MTTTLNKIKEHSPCKAGWEKLLNSLGKTKADDKSLDLLTILDSNGLQDTIWCFRAVDGYDFEIRGFARFCASQNIEKIKPYTTEEDYALITEWLHTGNENIRSAAESAAESARSAAWSAAWSAAESAAESARSAASAAESARSAAWSAARSAAESAASAARSAKSAASAAESAQEMGLRRLLGSTQNV